MGTYIAWFCTSPNSSPSYAKEVHEPCVNKLVWLLEYLEYIPVAAKQQVLLVLLCFSEPFGFWSEHVEPKIDPEKLLSSYSLTYSSGHMETALAYILTMSPTVTCFHCSHTLDTHIIECSSLHLARHQSPTVGINLTRWKWGQSGGWGGGAQLRLRCTGC